MIRISQIKLPVGHEIEALKKKIERLLKCQGSPFTYEIKKKSLDARKKEDKKFVYTVDVSISGEERRIKKVCNNNIMLIKKEEYHFPKPGDELLIHPPVIVGSGPAGLFCAWYLARAGYRPILLERGEEAPKRRETVEAFWKNGLLDPDSNVQFGEGGAGTFSDGKLNTLVKDPFGRNRQVMERFVKAGAPREILYENKPHLGTDVLVDLVVNLRRQIEDMGGSVHFRTKMTDLLFEKGVLTGVRTESMGDIPASVCVLALGHSARDTFEMLHQKGIPMEAKSFAAGLRIQHPQTMINKDCYGEEENELLGPASYKVTHTCKNGRGVYSFCMCPGGYVVNASSEEGMVAVNGMSYQARDSENANSAIIVTVTPEDFEEEGPLGGLAFVRSLEKKAFEAGEGKVPIQLFQDYCEGRKSTSLGDVKPCIKGEYAFGELRGIFSAEIGDSIEEGIRAFGKKIPGFDRGDAILCGVESRTSSPVRILRDKEMKSSVNGIYPCGEGAGYAGGITSAAMDGIKTAEAIARRFALPACPSQKN